MADIAHLVGSRLIKFNSPKVLCPPGRLVPQDGPLVIVATVMRAGTHLMIDTLLNNFESLRGTPPYVNLEQFLAVPDRDQRVAQLLATGGYVIKTHYPQLRSTVRDQADHVRQIARHARIIAVHRDPAETFRSMQTWLRDADPANTQGTTSSLESARDWDTYQATIAEFAEFWTEFPVLSIDQRRLTNASEFPRVIAEISEWIGLPARSTLVPCLPKNAHRRVYMAKVLTRLLGRRAPLINTTIRFAKT